MAVQYLGLGEFLLVAKESLCIDAGVLARLADLGGADSALNAPAAEFGGDEFYPDFVAKAAILTSRLVRNHPLPDGNKRVAFECLRTFLDLNGYRWIPPSPDPKKATDMTVQVMIDLAAGDLDEAGFEHWLRDRIQGEPE